MKILFVFVDGLGLGSNDPAVNPLADRDRFPNIGKLLENSVPLDAALGVPGLPQSATGQAALLTGLNAAKLMGRHIEGFPPPRLKALVQEHNIFSKLLATGKTCTFANDYWLDDVAHIPRRRESVTTVATLAAFGGVRGKAELAANRAVYHDLTREKLRDRGYTGPLITPKEAAEHLIAIADDHDFTLFEFFETDHAGHSGDKEQVFQTLEKLDRFFATALLFNGLLIVTSDHGNIEDLSVRTHTMNPVPLFASQPEKFQPLENISQLAPAIIQVLV
ncbi:MAG: alkaline phosphatase family protein [Verrucomicrobia bacterium]|nr:alkaline phosphatase family protein [Verrucomicrobiota bacterium]